MDSVMTNNIVENSGTDGVGVVVNTGFVGLIVAVGVGVGDAVGVIVGVGDAVGVIVGVGDAVGVIVGVGDVVVKLARQLSKIVT
jgi:hypothetical protein